MERTEVVYVYKAEFTGRLDNIYILARHLKEALAKAEEYVDHEINGTTASAVPLSTFVLSITRLYEVYH